MNKKDQNSIFVRYRHGSKLTVAPDMKKKLQLICGQLKKKSDYRAVLNARIKPINDGAGMGIHPESTWYHAIKELLSLY
jgi:hypothetical protein